MDLKQLALVLILSCAIVFGAGYKTAQFNEKREAEAVIDAKPVEVPPKQEEKNITVYVTGAVKKPGVYTLPDGARITAVLDKAEPDKEADLTGINLAELMKDEMPVYVPRKGEAESSGGGQTIVSSGKVNNISTKLKNGKVNINTAGSKELDQLKGIGPAMAERIIDYRNQHGKFRNIADLKQVSGIGTKIYEEIKERITI